MCAEVNPWQQKRLAERFELRGLQANPGTEGRLEQAGVSRRHAMPAQGMQRRRKAMGRIEFPGSYGLSGLPCAYVRREFAFLEHVTCLALIVIMHTQQPDRDVPRLRGHHAVFNQVQALPYAGNLARSRSRNHADHPLLASSTAKRHLFHTTTATTPFLQDVVGISGFDI